MNAKDVERAVDFLDRAIDTLETAGRKVVSDFQTTSLAAHIKTFLKEQGLLKETED